MSRSKIECRACHAELAHRKSSGRIIVDVRAAVEYEPHGEHGPFLRLHCACGTVRDHTVAGRFGELDEAITQLTRTQAATIRVIRANATV